METQGIFELTKSFPQNEETQANHQAERESHDKNDSKLNFQHFNFDQLIKNLTNNVPLKPCMGCANNVNHDTHTQSECAFLQHENERSETPTESPSSEDEKLNDTPTYHWREHKTPKNQKLRGENSFKSNDKRRERQQKIFEQKYPIYTAPNFNVYKWNFEENTNKDWPLKTKPEKYPKITKFLNRDKKRTICIEGNIAAGKSLPIDLLKKMGNPDVFTLHESIDKWKSLQH